MCEGVKFMENKMKKLYVLILLVFPMAIYAADINCGGEVTIIMDYPAKCNQNMAFKTTGSSEKWICVPSENGNAIVLSALAAGKSLGTYIDNQNGSLTCSSLPHYTKARYIVIYP